MYFSTKKITKRRRAKIKSKETKEYLRLFGYAFNTFQY
jgi:hypothetical protein